MSDRQSVALDEVLTLPGASAVVTAGGWTFIGGLLAGDRHGLADDVRVAEHERFIVDPMERQAEHVLRQLALALRAAGCDPATDVVRIWQWLLAAYPDDEDYRTGPSVWPHFPPAEGYVRMAKSLLTDPRRSSTGIGVRELPVDGALLAVDAIAVAGAGAIKQGFSGAVAAPGAYTPATRVGDLVFLAGNGATDFKGDWMSERHMGEPSMVAPEARVNPYSWIGSEIEAQTEYTLQRLSDIAEAAGSSLGRAVKADVTLGHPSDFVGFERVWRRWFPEDPPARTIVTGARLVLKGIRVEVAMILVADDANIKRTTITAPGVPDPIGAAPHAMLAGDMLFLSGLLGDDGIGAGAPHSRAGAQQASELFARMDAICAVAGASLSDVCKVQSFHRDLAHLPELLSGWNEAFPEQPPVHTAVGMGGADPLLIPGSEFLLDAIAWIPQAAA